MVEKANEITSVAAQAMMLSMCLMCAACAFTEKYPDTWSAPQSSVRGCPDLTGAYQAEGLVAPDKAGERERLDKDLFDAVGAKSVVISGPKDGAISVTAMQDETILSQILIEEETGWFFGKPGRFKCQRGLVVVLVKQGGGPILGVALDANWQTRSYSKAMDGALIVHTELKDTGITVFFPYYVSTETWALFPPTSAREEADAPKQNDRSPAGALTVHEE